MCSYLSRFRLAAKEQKLSVRYPSIPHKPTYLCQFESKRRGGVPMSQSRLRETKKRYTRLSGVQV